MNISIKISIKKSTILTIFILIFSGIPVYGFNSTDLIVGDLENNTEVYAYILSVDDDQNNNIQTNIFRAVNNLLSKDIKVYWTKSKINLQVKGLDYNDPVQSKEFKKGSFIIPLTGNHEKDVNISCQVFSCQSKFEDFVFKITNACIISDLYVLREPRIAHYDNECVLSLQKETLDILGFKNQRFVENQDIINNNLTVDDFDIFCFGGQAGASGEDLQKSVLSRDWKISRNKIRDFVKCGGNYVGFCHGSARSACKIRKPLCLPPNGKYPLIGNLLPINIGVVDCSIYRAVPGGGWITVEFVDMTHPITFGLSSVIKNHAYGGGPMFFNNLGSTAKPLGKIKDVDRDTWKYDWWMEDTKWYNNDLIPEKVKSNMINRSIDYSIGKTLWVEDQFGKGRAVVFGGHPEFPLNFSSNVTLHTDIFLPVRVLGNTIYYLCSEEVSEVDINHFVSFSKIKAETTGPSLYILDDEVDFSAFISNYSDPFYCSWNLKYRFNNQPFHSYEYYDYYYNYGYILDDFFNKDYYGLNPSYTFHNVGYYTTTFCVIDSCGFVDVNVFEIKIPDKLRVESIKDYYYAYPGETIDFSVNISGGAEPFYYEWYFDDGKISNEPCPSHIYDEPGYYHVDVMVTDDIGYYDSESVWVVVNDEVPFFNANVTIEPISRNSTHITYLFNVSVSKDGLYYYSFYFGRNKYSYSGWIEGDFYSVEHCYNFWSSYRLTDIFVLILNNQSNSYCVFEQFYINSPPLHPYISWYETDCIKGKKYLFKYCVLSELDCEDVNFIIDYGDGYVDDDHGTVVRVQKKINDGYYGGYSYNCFAEYAWKKPGKYSVKFKAVDENGYESVWSETVNVQVRKPTVLEFILIWLDRFQDKFKD